MRTYRSAKRSKRRYSSFNFVAKSFQTKKSNSFRLVESRPQTRECVSTGTFRSRKLSRERELHVEHNFWPCSNWRSSVTLRVSGGARMENLLVCHIRLSVGVGQRGGEVADSLKVGAQRSLVQYYCVPSLVSFFFFYFCRSLKLFKTNAQRFRQNSTNTNKSTSFSRRKSIARDNSAKRCSRRSIV